MFSCKLYMHMNPSTYPSFNDNSFSDTRNITSLQCENLEPFSTFVQIVVYNALTFFYILAITVKSSLFVGDYCSLTLSMNSRLQDSRL